MKDGEKRKKRHKGTPQLVTVPVLRKTIECPTCGEAIDIWASDERARCARCGYQVVTIGRQTH